MKKIKIIQQTTIAIFFIFFLSSCIFLTKKDIQKDEFKGSIVDIFDDPANHNLITFKIKTNKRVFTQLAIYEYSWDYAEIGDSIIKESGNMFIIIKKANGDSKIFYYNH